VLDHARRPRPLVASALAAGAGLALLVTAAAGMAHNPRVPPDFGVTSAPNSRALSPGPSRPDVGPPVVPEPPTALAIPALRVQATVVPVDTSGEILGVPADPAQVGWWTGSALPGAASGTVAIDGHIDSASTGPGAFYQLANLHIDDLLIITTTTGDRRNYAVTGRRTYHKANGLPPDLFATTGPPRLVLITCSGSFDRSTGSYSHNIVVFAAPT
jgi:Sortase domain